MLKIPKQIYFDEPMLELYSAYAEYTNQPFAAVIRETLEKQSPTIKAVISTKKPTSDLMSLFGSVKSPYKRKFTAREERKAFEQAMGERAAKRGLYD